MTILEEDIARYVLNNCPARKDSELMRRFGISYNTLRKIEARQPLRASLAARLQSLILSEWEGQAADRQLQLP